ncbi:hypothetical protein IJ765_01605 [Candidatus Saccharibacteria bacterium]|nr:hypothetical protein [Candidatus Saccharibacteria bacterium]
MKLVIIDGKSVFYRGFYAMGALSRSDGKPTGGVYGFAVIAMELVREIKPDKVVVAWDKAKTSISKRKAIYADYKAGRTKPPEAFFEQIPLLVELIHDLGWTFLETDDYEADDIIGTLAKQADEIPGSETIIISSDLDMLQIVDENTRMYRLLKGFSELEEIDVKALEEKYGIKQAQFLDMKALKGDNSDNIPGVPGIGEKTAVKLLNDYGSLDGIYQHIDEIKGATQKKLVEGKDSAYMSYQLAKIMFDAPVKLADVPDLVIDAPKIIEGLRKLEFNSLIRKFQKQSLGEQEPTLRVVPGDELYKDERVELPAEFKPEIVEWDVKAKMWQNADFAEKVIGGAKVWDLNQGRFVLSGKKGDDRQGQLGLDFGETDKRIELEAQQKEFLEIPKAFKVFSELDMPLIPVLFKMEKRGMLISREYFNALKEEFAAEIVKLERKIMELAGQEFNINSPIQLNEVLFEKLRLPTQGIKKTQRGYSTGVDTLEKLKDAHEIIPLIMEYRQITKLQSTYVLPLPELADKDGRVHTRFTQDVTATGRLSSVNPNLQNIPVRTEEGKRIRTGFVAPEGKVLVSADYSQFELRLAAVLAGDQPLIDDFNAGIDIHKKTASDVFNVPMEEVTKAQRRAAKVVNFGVLYGMSAQGLAKAADMQFYEAKEFIDNYFLVRKPIRDYLNKILTQAREQGYVETYFGRRKPTPGVKAGSFVIRQAEERAAQNMPIQGTEADLMKKAMIQVDAKLPAGAELVMQVHDSLIVECDAGQVEEVSKILQETMEGIAPELPIKLAVEVTSGGNWGSL